MKDIFNLKVSSHFHFLVVEKQMWKKATDMRLKKHNYVNREFPFQKKDEKVEWS